MMTKISQSFTCQECKVTFRSMASHGRFEGGIGLTPKNWCKGCAKKRKR